MLDPSYRVTHRDVPKLSIQGLCNSHTGPELRVWEQPNVSLCIGITYWTLLQCHSDIYMVYSFARDFGILLQDLVTWDDQKLIFNGMNLALHPVLTVARPFSTVETGHCDNLGTWQKQSQYPISVKWWYDLFYQKTKSRLASSHNIQFLPQGDSHNIHFLLYIA